MWNCLKSTKRVWLTLVTLFVGIGLVGCARRQERPMITAFGLSPNNRCDPPGIPYYLPKPLLVVSKNFRHIDESKVGLTAPAPIPEGFDNQSAYADIKSNLTVPGTSSTPATGGSSTVDNTFASQDPQRSIVAESMMPSGRLEDGVAPDSFFTYQVIFVPDLTQKYGLQITGGAGEFRAAMNMVNGWMYTGMGPFYFKDSSSAQNAMATGAAAMYAGRGTADVISQVGDLTTAIGALKKNSPETQQGNFHNFATAFHAVAKAATTTPKVPDKILNYAEVYIYEPVLMHDETTEWRLVAEHHFDRDFFSHADESDAAVASRHAIMRSMVEGLSKVQGATSPKDSKTETKPLNEALMDLNHQTEALRRKQGSERPDSIRRGPTNPQLFKTLPPPKQRPKASFPAIQRAVPDQQTSSSAHTSCRQLFHGDRPRIHTKKGSQTRLELRHES